MISLMHDDDTHGDCECIMLRKIRKIYGNCWLTHEVGYCTALLHGRSRKLDLGDADAFALPIAFAFGLGLGFWPTFIALVPLAIPPMLTNAYVGTRAVDRDVIESARGMGMAELGILRRIELPLALPLVLAGMRTSAVNVVATATLGALVAGGGLGRYIVDGLGLQEYDRLFAGALLVALLAIGVEVAFGTFERRATSPGLRAEPATL
jgi:osmoprotectant transport system permease protein